MGNKVTRDLVEVWEIGKVLLTCHGTDLGDLTIVGKEDGLLQLARSLYLKGKDRIIIVEEYNPKQIKLNDCGGCIEEAVSTREIAVIILDEYYGRVNPTNELNKKYIQILRGF